MSACPESDQTAALREVGLVPLNCAAWLFNKSVIRATPPYKNGRRMWEPCRAPLGKAASAFQDGRSS